MATPELKFKLSIDGKEFTGVLDDAGQRVNRFGDSVASSAAKAGTRVQGLTGHLSTMGHAAAGAFATGKLTAMTDAYASLNARVALASQGIGSAALAQQRLFEIAEKSRVGVEGLSEVYSTLAKAGGELGFSQARVLGITETLSKAMTLSGGSADSARAAMVQFGQGLQAGTLRGDELNSVLEQAPRLAQALAEGLGKPVGALKAMAEQGQITTEAIFSAMERMKGKIDTEFEQLPTTVGQAMTVMQNSLLKTIGVFDQAGGVSRGFADGIMSVSKNMDTAVIGAAAVGTAYVVLRNSTVAATVATQGLALAQGALGGPIGLIATALGVAATAWVTWKVTATQSEQTVQAQVAESDADIVKRIQGQIDKLRERNQLAGAPIPKGENQNSLDAAGRYTEAYAKWQALVSGKDAVVGASEQTVVALLAARNERIEQAGKDVAAAFSLYDNLNTAMTADGAAKTTASREKFMASYASSGEKLAKQIADYDKEFAGKVSASQRATDIAAIKAAAPKAAAGGLSEATKGLTLYNDLLDQASGYTASYAEDQNKLAAAFKSGLIPSYADYTTAVQALLDKQPFMAKTRADEKKALADSAKELASTMEAYTRASEAGVASAIATAAAAETELANYGLLKSAVQELTLVHLEQARESAAMAGEDVANIETRIAAQKRLIAATRGLEGRAAGEDAAKLAKQTAADAGAEWQKSVTQYENIFREGFASLVNGGKDTWKSFTKSLATTFKTSVADQIYKSFAQPFVVKFVASMLGVVGGGLSGAANAAGSIAGGAATGIGGTIAGFAATAASWGTAAGAGFMATLGGSTVAGGAAAGVLATGGAAGASTAGMIGAAAPYALAAVAALAAFGAFRTTKQTGTGISGTLGDDGSLTGFDEMRKSGYLLGGPKYWDEVKAMDPLMAQALKTDFASIKTAATGAAGALGLASDSVAGFNKAFRIEFSGDKAKDEALYKDLMAGVSEDLAKTILGSYRETIVTVIDQIGINDGSGEGGNWTYGDAVERQVATSTYTPSEFAREGETASQTLQRLASSITLVNTTSDTLGNKLLGVGLKGANTASLLIDAFGGAEAYATSASGFYQNFFTAAERTARLTETTRTAFEKLGLTMPVLDEGARAAYRSLVEEAAAKDMTVEANRNAYASLMALQGPMNELAPAFADVANVFEDLADRVKSVMVAIADERMAVSDAARQIMGSTVMSKAQIERGIAATGVTMPGNAEVVAAQSDLAQADAKITKITSSLGTYGALLSKAASEGLAQLGVSGFAGSSALEPVDLGRNTRYTGGVPQLLSDPTLRWSYGFDVGLSGRTEAAAGNFGGAFDKSTGVSGYNPAMESVKAAYSYIKTTLEPLGSMGSAQAAQASATAAAKKAATDYTAAMQLYTGDAEKAVKALSKLREESVKYYESQKALAGVMVNSAANLRGAAIALRNDQLDPVQSVARQQAEFAQNYSMALATTGAEKAGYADKLASALPGLSEAIRATSSVQTWGLASAKLAAQSLAMATSLDAAAAAMNYEAESLTLLGSIDAALNNLDTNTTILKQAIDGGTATSAAGLRAIVSQLGGVPSFDVGTNYVPHDMLARIHKGEAVVPKRYNQPAPRAAGGGVGGIDVAEIVAELRAMRQENAQLRAEIRAITVHAARTADATARMDRNGVMVYTDPAEPLKIEVVAA